MAISAELAMAYLVTEFVVRESGTEIHFPGQGLSADLGNLLTRYGVDTAAFLTAYNSRSEPTSQSENEARQLKLIEQITGYWNHLSGEGRDPTGHWPPEPSLLILGVSLADSQRLADQYGQNAFVFIESPGRSTLVATNKKEQHLIEEALRGHPGFDRKTL